MPTQFPTDLPFQQATAQAALALLGSDPNLRVGCVIFDREGHLLGQGHTQCVGEVHAEVMALRAARANMT